MLRPITHKRASEHIVAAHAPIVGDCDGPLPAELSSFIGFHMTFATALVQTEIRIDGLAGSFVRNMGGAAP